MGRSASTVHARSFNAFSAMALALILACLCPFAAHAEPDAQATLPINELDFRRLREVITPLAEKGDGSAQLQLGILFQQGWGGAKDCAAAATWYEAASGQGVDVAGFFRSRLLAKDACTSEQDSVTLDWWLNAAEIGDHVSQFAVGIMYANGVGASANPKKAFFWLTLATKGPTHGLAKPVTAVWSDFRTRIGARLTKPQRNKALVFARRWKAATGQIVITARRVE